MQHPLPAAPLALFRAHSREGAGEGPTRAVRFGEQFLDPPRELWADEVVDGVRLWMTLSNASMDVSLLGEGLTGWSVFRHGAWDLVARMCVAPQYAEFDSRTPYFTHAWAWPAELGVDPGLLLGHAGCFDAPWTGKARPAEATGRVTGLPTLDEAALEPHARLLRNLVRSFYSAMRTGQRVVISLPPESFGADSPWPRLLGAARACLPRVLRQGLNIQHYTVHPARLMGHTPPARVVVVPNRVAIGALREWPEAVLLDAAGEQSRGAAPHPDVDAYAAEVLQLALSSSEPLGRFTAELDRLLGEDLLPGRWLRSLMESLYNVAVAQGSGAWSGLLTGVLLPAALSGELAGRSTWTALLPEGGPGWSGASVEALARLALAPELPPAEARGSTPVVDLVAEGGGPGVAEESAPGTALRALAEEELARRLQTEGADGPTAAVWRPRVTVWWETGTRDAAALGHLLHLREEALVDDGVVAGLSAQLGLDALAAVPRLLGTLLLCEVRAQDEETGLPRIAARGAHPRELARALRTVLEAGTRRTVSTALCTELWKATLTGRLHPAWGAIAAGRGAQDGLSLEDLLPHVLAAMVEERPPGSSGGPPPPPAPEDPALADLDVEHALAAVFERVPELVRAGPTLSRPAAELLTLPHNRRDLGRRLGLLEILARARHASVAEERAGLVAELSPRAGEGGGGGGGGGTDSAALAAARTEVTRRALSHRYEALSEHDLGAPTKHDAGWPDTCALFDWMEDLAPWLAKARLDEGSGKVVGVEGIHDLVSFPSWLPARVHAWRACTVMGEPAGIYARGVLADLADRERRVLAVNLLLAVEALWLFLDQHGQDLDRRVMRRVGLCWMAGVGRQGRPPASLSGWKRALSLLDLPITFSDGTELGELVVADELRALLELDAARPWPWLEGHEEQQVRDLLARAYDLHAASLVVEAEALYLGHRHARDLEARWRLRAGDLRRDLALPRPEVHGVLLLSLSADFVEAVGGPPRFRRDYLQAVKPPPELAFHVISWAGKRVASAKAVLAPYVAPGLFRDPEVWLPRTERFGLWLDRGFLVSFRNRLHTLDERGEAEALLADPAFAPVLQRFDEALSTHGPLPAGRSAGKGVASALLALDLGHAAESLWADVKRQLVRITEVVKDVVVGGVEGVTGVAAGPAETVSVDEFEDRCLQALGQRWDGAGSTWGLLLTRAQALEAGELHPLDGLADRLEAWPVARVAELRRRKALPTLIRLLDTYPQLANRHAGRLPVLRLLLVLAPSASAAVVSLFRTTATRHERDQEEGWWITLRAELGRLEPERRRSALVGLRSGLEAVLGRRGQGWLQESLLQLTEADADTFLPLDGALRALSEHLRISP